MFGFLPGEVVAPGPRRRCILHLVSLGLATTFSPGPRIFSFSFVCRATVVASGPRRRFHVLLNLFSVFMLFQLSLSVLPLCFTCVIIVSFCAMVSCHLYLSVLHLFDYVLDYRSCFHWFRHLSSVVFWALASPTRLHDSTFMLCCHAPLFIVSTCVACRPSPREHSPCFHLSFVARGF